MPTNQLPRDILVKILQYLPFESIKACKLVSKEWNNLITDDPRLEYRRPSFASFHIQNSLYCVSTKITNPVKISSRCNNPPMSVDRIPIEWKDDDEFITQLLSESSKGIACVVTNKDRLLFYNLFTGASYPSTELPAKAGLFIHGFGYDSFADDCKMISVSAPLFWVYSLRNRAWKSFEGFPYATYYINKNWDQSLACSFNGVLHWLVDKRDRRACQNHFHAIVLTYDLHTCRFGEMLLPDFPSGYGYPRNIGEIGGHLSYCCCSNYKGPILMVSTMREYGVSESWTSFLSIDLTKIRRRLLREMIEPSKLLYRCLSGRKLLFVCKHIGTLYWYDIDNHKVTIIQKNTWEKMMNRKRKRQELEGMQQHIWLDR